MVLCADLAISKVKGEEFRLPVVRSIDVTKDTKIGFIGLGKVGSEMVQRLAEDEIDVITWNRSTKAPSNNSDHLHSALTPEAVFSDSEIVLMCLSDGRACKQVLDAIEDRKNEGVTPKVLVNLTTIHPAEAKKLSEQAAAKGFEYVDIAFTGGIPSVKNRSSFFIVSCQEQFLIKVLPILSRLGSKVMHVDDAPGTAQLYKAANQIISAIHHYGVCLTVALAKSQGVDLQLVSALIHDEKNTTLSSWATRNKLDAIIAENFSGHHSAENFLKDIQIARSLVRNRMFRRGEIFDEVMHVKLWQKYLLQAERALKEAVRHGDGEKASHVMVKYTKHDRRAYDFTKFKIKRYALQGVADPCLQAVSETLREYPLFAAMGAISDLSDLFKISEEAIFFMLDSGSGSSGYVSFFKDLRGYSWDREPSLNKELGT